MTRLVDIYAKELEKEEESFFRTDWWEDESDICFEIPWSCRVDRAIVEEVALLFDLNFEDAARRVIGHTQTAIQSDPDNPTRWDLWVHVNAEGEMYLAPRPRAYADSSDQIGRMLGPIFGKD